MPRTRLVTAFCAAAVVIAASISPGVGVPDATAAPAAMHAGISGVVVDSAGHPLAGVRVSAASWISFADAPVATTDRSGRFAIDTGPGDFELDVAAGRATGGNSDATGYYAAANPGLIRVGVGTMRSGVRIRLHPAGVVVGHVSDGHGHPLSGVHPYLAPVVDYVTGDAWGAGPVNAAVRPSRRGWYRITGVPPGAYQVCMAAAYVHVTGGIDDAAGYADTCRPAGIAVGAARTSHAGTVTSLPLSGGGIAGRVVGYDHAPLAHVHADVYLSRGTSVLAVTDADGRFWAHGMRAGTYRICFTTENVAGPSHTGYAPGCRGGVVVRRHRLRHLTTVLTAGAAASGTVTGAGGGGLSGAPIQALRGQGAYDGPITNTGDAGRYQFRNLAPSRAYDLCALTDFSTAAGATDPTGGVPDCTAYHGRKVDLRAGATTRVDLGLSAAGGVRGTLTRPDGTPLADVEVDLEGPDRYGNQGEFYAFTDSHGRYAAVDLPPAKYEVCFSDVYFYEKCYRTPTGGREITVTRGSFVDGIDATLPHTPAPSIGLVVSDGRGRRLSGVDAVLFKRCRSKSFECARRPLLGARATSHADVITDARGRADLIPNRPGTYSLCLFAYYGGAAASSDRTGYADKCLARPVTIPKHGSGATVRVRLHRAGAVSGVATDPHGKPLADVYVQVTGSAAAHVDTAAGPLEFMSPLFEARTDSRGPFLIRSVAPGVRRVTGGGRVSVRAGRVTRGLHVTLSPATARASRVRRAAAQPGAAPPAWHRPANRLRAWHAVRREAFPRWSFQAGAAPARDTGRPGSRAS